MKNNLNSLRECLIDSLVESKIELEQSKRIADAVIEKVAFRYKGQNLYIGKKDNKQRNQKILKEFNGKNHIQLALKYKLTVATIYAIIKEDIKKKQISLFNE